MTISRAQQIDLSSTPYYHCINRCVRRAFLCGEDAHTGQSYEHRRGWIADKLTSLTSIFAIDVVAYSVMSNHYHVILRVDEESALDWSYKEVVFRWQQLFNLPTIIAEYMREDSQQSEAELETVYQQIDEWRERLYSISWYMRIVNEHIAREANKEDDVKGRFWEGRFKSQALLDEQVLITCMAYVDLNPIRANIAKTPETSEFTSIEERIRTAFNSEPSVLLPFADKADYKDATIPFKFNDYINLIDWSGRAILLNKKGSIPNDIPPILTRLGIDKTDWINHIHYFERRFPTVAGNLEKLKQFAKQTDRNWIKGIGNAFNPIPI